MEEVKELHIYEKLMNVQQELRAGKNLKNAVMHFSYRSAEMILEAVKPLLKANRLILTLEDSVQSIGETNYVYSKATLINVDNAQEAISTTAYAREDMMKKGLDSPQMTGSASSYARKYALNGLFAIDDNKDNDTTNVTPSGEKTYEQKAKSATFEEKVAKVKEYETALRDLNEAKGKTFNPDYSSKSEVDKLYNFVIKYGNTN